MTISWMPSHYKVLNLITFISLPEITTRQVLNMIDYGNSDLKVTPSEARSDHYCDQGVGLGILLLTALGVGIMFFTLYTKVTMAMTARKKRLSDDDLWSLQNLEEYFISGNEIHNDFLKCCKSACTIGYITY